MHGLLGNGDVVHRLVGQEPHGRVIGRGLAGLGAEGEAALHEAQGVDGEFDGEAGAGEEGGGGGAD